MTGPQVTEPTVLVSVVELEIVRRLLVAAANLTIGVLESDDGGIPVAVGERARDVQALFGELDA